IFDGDGSGYPDGGIDDMSTTATQLRAAFPSTPVWITEMNVNADWGNDTHKRPWTQFAAAWWGSAFADLAPTHVEMLHQYDVIDAPQYALIDDQTGATNLPYWIAKPLNTSFPLLSTLLQTSSTVPTISFLAARPPCCKGSI